jgi:hypothetical protein
MLGFIYILTIRDVTLVRIVFWLFFILLFIYIFMPFNDNYIVKIWLDKKYIYFKYCQYYNISILEMKSKLISS